jgi:hypothetical protein
MAITQNKRIIVYNVHEFNVVNQLRQLPNGTYQLERAPGLVVATYSVANGSIS